MKLILVLILASGLSACAAKDKFVIMDKCEKTNTAELSLCKPYK